MNRAAMDWILVPKGSWCYRQSNLPLNPLQRGHFGTRTQFLIKLNNIISSLVLEQTIASSVEHQMKQLACI